jgi:hypothetical protein
MGLLDNASPVVKKICVGLLLASLFAIFVAM